MTPVKHGQDARATQKIQKRPWPPSLPERVSAVRAALADCAEPTDVADIARRFSKARKATIEEILETLVAVGQARQTDDGRYVAWRSVYVMILCIHSSPGRVGP